MLVSYKEQPSIFIYPKYLSEKSTTIGTVIKDKNVESTTVLAMLSVILFGEYIFAIKQVKTADGMEV